MLRGPRAHRGRAPPPSPFPHRSPGGRRSGGRLSVFWGGGAPRTQKVLNHAHTQQDVSGQMEKEAEWPHSPQGPRQRDRPEVRGRPSEGLRNAGPAPTSAPAWEPSQMGQRGPGGRQGRFPGPFHPASVHGGGVSAEWLAPQGPGTSLLPSHDPAIPNSMGTDTVPALSKQQHARGLGDFSQHAVLGVWVVTRRNADLSPGGRGEPGLGVCRGHSASGSQH